MESFTHHTPELRIHHGPDSLTRLGPELDRLGCRRAIVFCGRTLSRPGAALERVADALGDRFAAAFVDVAAHSPVENVEKGARMILQSRADAVVALGGGSAIVSARAAGILAAEGAPARQLCTRLDASGAMHSPRLSAPKLPQFVLPTTPTTACVKAGSAVHDTSGARLALFDPKTRARALCIDAGLISATPVALVRDAALNAFAMAAEGLESAQGDPLADGLLMHALRLLAAGLPRLVEDADDPQLRGELVLAAVLCGQGTDHAGGGLASVLGHAIGARCGVANGLVNALVLPHTMRFNAAHTAPRAWKIMAALGGVVPGLRGNDPAGHLHAALAPLALPVRLRDIGLARDDIPAVARDAQSDFFLRRNPRPLEGPAELEELIESMW